MLRSLSCVCILTFASALQSIGPSTWSTNNHQYKVFIVTRGQNVISPAGGTWDGVTWATANSTAQSMGGYLATIGSQSEHNFIINMIKPWMYPQWCVCPGQCCEKEPNPGTCASIYSGGATCGIGNANTSGFDLWIGLSNQASSTNWNWVTGPEIERVNVCVKSGVSRTCSHYHFFHKDEPSLATTSCGVIREGNQYDSSFYCEAGGLWASKSCTDTYGYVVEWDPASPTTVQPTKTPTKTPTTNTPTTSISLTNAPTTNTPTTTVVSPTPACGNCSVSLCPRLNFFREPATCERLRKLGEIGSSWSASPLLARAAQNTICCYLDWWANQTSTCHGGLNQSLYDDICAQLRSGLFPELQSEFANAGWCGAKTSRNFSDVVTCPALTSVTYATPTNETVLPIVATNQLPCVELSQKQYIAKNPTYQELGPLAAVYENSSQYPDIPPIQAVENTDRTTALLYNTACLQPAVVNLGWLLWLIGFYVFAAICLFFLYKRREFLPVRARTPILMYGSVFWLVVNFTWVAIDQITGMTAPCGLISFGNLVAFPMLLFTYLLRALRLLFLYLSSVRKLSHKKDWFFEHRNWLTLKFSIGALSAAFVCFIIIFIIANAMDGTFTDTYLGSGRCHWWDINQQIAQAASSYGVDLGPTQYNQNGFVPYSVEYSSCVFCTSSGTNAFLATLTGVLLLLLLASLATMSRLRDQYLLRLELVGVLCAFSVIAVLRVLMFFPSSAQSLMDNLGLDVSLLLMALVLILALLASTVFPAAMTYSRRYRLVDTAVSTLKSKGEPTLEEVLGDPVGIGLFKQFETESFQVENVSFYQEMEVFSALALTDPQRGVQAQMIHATYIQQDALMAVNIDYVLRCKYDTPESRVAPDAFQDVLAVILMLLKTNSWMRFRKSSLWTEYLKDLSERQQDGHELVSQMESTLSIASTPSRSRHEE